MIVRKLVAAASLSLVAVCVTHIPADAAAPRKFDNCTAMNKVYPHGVGKRGAVDKTSGTRVTNFHRNAALYRANASSDRDKDGIACEKA